MFAVYKYMRSQQNANKTSCSDIPIYIPASPLCLGHILKNPKKLRTGSRLNFAIIDSAGEYIA